jgi:hypothetical protein
MRPPSATSRRLSQVVRSRWRSCDTSTIAPSYSCSARVSAWRISRSRWLVGSSSSSRLGAARSAAPAPGAPSRRRRRATTVVEDADRRGSRSRRGNRAVLLARGAGRGLTMCAAAPTRPGAVAPAGAGRSSRCVRSLPSRRRPRRRQPPGEQLDQRRLARAVAAEQADALARAQVSSRLQDACRRSPPTGPSSSAAAGRGSFSGLEEARTRRASRRARAAMRCMRSSALMRLCAWRALVALARKRRRRTHVRDLALLLSNIVCCCARLLARCVSKSE